MLPVLPWAPALLLALNVAGNACQDCSMEAGSDASGLCSAWTQLQGTWTVLMARSQQDSQSSAVPMASQPALTLAQHILQAARLLRGSARGSWWDLGVTATAALTLEVCLMPLHPG